MRTNSRPVARAIDSPIDVLPVPGGPMRVRMAPALRSASIPRSSRSLRTAMYSVMRSLTSSRPAWSASSTSRAWTGSRISSERFVHGTVMSQSRYVRIICASPDCSPAALEALELALGLLAHVRRACPASSILVR